MDIDMLLLIAASIIAGLMVARKTYLDGIAKQELGKLERTKLAKDTERLLKQAEISADLERAKIELGNGNLDFLNLVNTVLPLISKKQEPINSSVSDDISAGEEVSTPSPVQMSEGPNEGGLTAPGSPVFDEFVRSGQADRFMARFGKYLK